MNNKNTVHVVLGPVRFNYVHVDEKYDFNNSGDPKYSIMALVPKDNEKLVEKMQEAYDQAVQLGIASKYGGKKPAKIFSPIHDGDERNSNGEFYGEECKGHYLFTATSRDKPGRVVGGDRRQAEDGDIYSGCHGYIGLNFSPYDWNGRKGIGVYLTNVWKTQDDEKIGFKGVTTEDDFAGIEIELNETNIDDLLY